MTLSFRFGLYVLLLVVFLLLPLVAFAQEVAAPATPSWVPLVITVLAAIAGSGLVSTGVKSNKWWMKIIDAIALNWGKARNDPRVN